jgi:D-glycerate 3-kinase
VSLLICVIKSLCAIWLYIQQLSEHFMNKFLSRHQLTISYLEKASKCFLPLLDKIVALAYSRQGQPLVIGINGCQGSGKSTLADYLCTMLKRRHDIKALAVSLDDFYLSKVQRVNLADTVHPLLATRGVPGTHDVSLAINTVKALKDITQKAISIPVFDKAIDDQDPRSKITYTGVRQIIIFEGWCLGATAQTKKELILPINSLEREHDSDGRWRKYVNNALGEKYPQLFELIDLWVMLQAPSFNCVYQWRREQEHKLAQKKSELDLEHRGFIDDTSLKVFIQHYQRVTQQCLNKLPNKMHYLYLLDNARLVIKQMQPKTYPLCGDTDID